MTFDRPDLLWLAFVLPLAVAVGIVLFARRRRSVVRTLGDAALVERLGGAGLLAFPVRRLLLLALGAASLGFAAAGPRWGTLDQATESRAVNVVLALDISKSMLAQDVSPDRLERARLLARRLMREMRTDRIGLVVFAGRAYVLSPLTTDHGALDLYLDALDPDIVSQGGSSLAAALAQASDLARGRDDTGGDRAVVLITDGEALEDEGAVLDAAQRAQRAGVRVFTVGVGTERGAPIPDIDPRTGQDRGYKREESGQIVISRLGEDLLRRVARTAEGSYFALDNAGAAGALVAELRELQRASSAGARRTTRREQYAWFVALALLMLALDAWLARTYAPVRTRTEVSDAELPPARVHAPRRPRPMMETAALLVLCVLVSGFGVGDLERGNRLYREGRYEEAVAAYRGALEDGEGTPELHYNLGTALLALGRYSEAERHLQLALRDVDPELRRRTYYNLGNRHLRAARENSDAQAQIQQLGAAIEAYKHALRLAPDDVDAKWNLELAQRKRDEQEQQQPDPQQQQEEQDESEQQDEEQGSGQSGAPPTPGQGGQGSEGRSQFEQQPMTREQAEQILAAVEQDERELTREKLRKGQRRTPVARDW